MKKMILGKKYEVKWIDTFSFNGWYTADRLKQEAKECSDYLTSVGIYGGEYHGFVVLCNSLNTNEKFSAMCGHPNWIPKGCIKRIINLTKKL